MVFVSDASDLVPGDANGQVDVFVRDRVAATTTRVSASSAGTEADGNSIDPAISADGRFVAFHSAATNLIEGEWISDANVYVHELATGTTELSVSGGADLRRVWQQLSAVALGRRPLRRVRLAERARRSRHQPAPGRVRTLIVPRHVTSRVSVASRRRPGGDLGRRGSEDPAISADGRYVAFTSDARDLVAGVDRFDVQIYVRDRVAGTTTLASVNAARRRSRRRRQPRAGDLCGWALRRASTRAPTTCTRATCSTRSTSWCATPRRTTDEGDHSRPRRGRLQPYPVAERRWTVGRFRLARLVPRCWRHQRSSIDVLPARRHQPATRTRPR